MKKLISTVLALSAVPVMAFAGSALADSPGQLISGSNFYVVKNVTQSGSYGASASATCNDEVQYSIDLHNGAYGGLTNINVKATLSNAGSTATATPAEGAAAGASGSVTTSVSGSNASLVYENGTTKLYDGSGNVVKTLPDTITTSGVNVGDLNGSTVEFVNFRAKVSCNTPTPVCTDKTATNNGGPLPCTYPQPKPTPTPTPTPAPKALPNTGAGDIAEVFVGVSTFGAAAHAVTRRFRR